MFLRDTFWKWNCSIGNIYIKTFHSVLNIWTLKQENLLLPLKNWLNWWQHYVIRINTLYIIVHWIKLYVTIWCSLRYIVYSNSNNLEFLKSFIDLNTGLLKIVKNEFEKSLFKLMNNCVFGKTMENVRKRVIEVNNIMVWQMWCWGLNSQSRILSATIFNQDIVVIDLKNDRSGWIILSTWNDYIRPSKNISLWVYDFKYQR